jgi:MoaA/NifB/PqqE/SkfB family radical SAM enzyme
MTMKMDESFVAAFDGRIHQAFFYLIDKCNLSCDHCLYKQELTFQMGDPQIPFDRAVALMENLYELGAMKMTFMGGEPTMYKQLPELILEAKRIGYKYVRIDTNGMFAERLLDTEGMRALDEITFSMDGPTEELNDRIRGIGVFKQVTRSIRAAVERGYNVQITTCVQSPLTWAGPETGELPLVEMVRLAKSLGVKGLNMHDLFKAGIPRDGFSGNHGTTVEEYMNAFEEIFSRFDPMDEDGFFVRMPQCVTTKEEFDRAPAYYGYCSVKQYDRILAFPNGQLRICSLMIGSPYCIGYYDDHRVYLNTTPTDETRDHKMDTPTPCTCQSKGKHFGDYVPLCVSFKPKQYEPVWIHRHKWEERREDPHGPLHRPSGHQTLRQLKLNMDESEPITYEEGPVGREVT